MQLLSINLASKGTQKPWEKKELIKKRILNFPHFGRFWSSNSTYVIVKPEQIVKRFGA